MKTNFLKMMSSVLLFSAIAVFSSCEKDDKSDAGRSLTGTTNIRLVNAVEGSYPQNFYLNDTKINIGVGKEVSYGNSTPYYPTNAGSRTPQFRADATDNVTVVTPALNFSAGEYYTAYMAGHPLTPVIYVTLDDRTLPATNRARVRFISLSPAASTGLDFQVTGGQRFVTGLAYLKQTPYFDFDPSTTINIYTAGGTTPIISIPTFLSNGRIYTVYVSGTSTSTFKYFVNTEN